MEMNALVVNTNPWRNNEDGITLSAFSDKETWANARLRTIGGSDASCIMGANPYKTNVRLWEEKVLGTPSEDVSDNPLVRYGTDAEEPLRHLFALDYQDKYTVGYIPNNFIQNEKYPYCHYSADGWLIDKSNGELGILEIKTTTISSGRQRDLWKDRVPDNYYVQCLHAMLITGAKFVVLKAQMKNGLDWNTVTKHYTINRKDVEADLDILEYKEFEFAECLKTGKKPPLLLPEI